MDIYLTYSDVTQHPLYNCSMITDVYRKTFEVKHPIHGILSIAWGVLSLFLYLLCLFAMLSKEQIQYSCYKIMVYLAIIDIGGIGVSSFAFGLLLIKGASFCTYPNFIYILGSVGMYFWLGESLTSLLLVGNRIIEVMYPELSRILFTGWRTVLIIFLGPVLYGFVGMAHGASPLFNSMLQAFFFDPFIYEGRTLEYANPLHFYNNIVVCSLTCICYGMFCINFQRKFRHYFKDKKSKKNAHVFVQASIICFFNLVAALIYVVMQFFALPAIFVHIAQISFQLVHSCPPYIYILFNRALRRKILSFFGVGYAKGLHNTSGVNTVAGNKTAPHSSVIPPPSTGTNLGSNHEFSSAHAEDLII